MWWVFSLRPSESSFATNTTAGVLWCYCMKQKWVRLEGVSEKISLQSLAANSQFDMSRLCLSNSNTWHSLTKTTATNCSTLRFPHTSSKVQKSRQPPPVLHTRPARKQFHRALCKESRNESRVGNIDICLPLSGSWICRRHKYLWGVFVWRGEE